VLNLEVLANLLERLMKSSPLLPADAICESSRKDARKEG
jgi:hypothetical protein